MQSKEEKLKQYKHDWWLKNRDRKKVDYATYRENNRTALNDKAKDYYQRNKEKVLEKARKRYQENRKKLIEKNLAYTKTPAGRKTQKRAREKLMNRLSNSMYHMLLNDHRGPKSIPKLGVFADNGDVEAHFRSTFEPWMNMSNHGKYRMGDQYDQKWNIGHRLPKTIFDPSNDADLKRCWDRRNLFAQCARANIEAKDRLVLSDEELLQLKELWPQAAGGDLDALKALF
jgi:hypothetical protein